MQVGSVFTYSGYMVTHRQQLQKSDMECEPFVNIISYNSKWLFGNLIESFWREIHADKKNYSQQQKVKFKQNIYINIKYPEKVVSLNVLY